jgi:hypothetical protein
MKRFAWLGLGLLGGCSLLLGIEDLPGGGNGDGGIRDGGPDAIPPPPAVLALDTDRYDMGAALVGAPSTPGVVTVTNVGTTRTGKLTPAAGAAAFSTGGSCVDAELDPGASCAVEITLNPASVGALETTLSVTAYGGGSAEATLLGEGLAGGTLRSDSALDFGALGLDLAGVPRALSVTNAGGTGLSGLMTVRVTGQDRGWFALSRNECGGYSVAPIGDCELKLRPVARRAGSGRAVLAIDSPTGGAWVVPLTATGYATGVLTLTATHVNFPATAIGATSAVQSIMVTNAGDAETGPISATWTGGGGALVVSNNGCAAGLLPATSCTLELVAQPTAAGTFLGNLRLAGATRGAAMVTGTVNVPVPGILDVSTTTLALPAKQIGTAPVAIATFRAYNRGGTALGSTTVSSSNPTEFAVGISSCAAAGPNGGACTVTVTFNPSATGLRTATVTVTSGDQVKTVAASGMATDSTLVRFIDPANFGVVASNQLVTATLSNVDDTPATVVSIVSSDPQFVVENGPGVDCEVGVAIGALSTCDITVRFTPGAPGVKVATLTVTTDNVLGPVAILPMYGVGEKQISIPTDGTWSIYPPPSAGTALCNGAGSCIRQMVDANWQATYVSAPELTAPFPRQNWGADPDPICDGHGRTPCPMNYAQRGSYNGTHPVPPFVSAAVTGSGGFMEDPSVGILCPPLCEGRARNGTAFRVAIRTVDAMLTASSCAGVCEGTLAGSANVAITVAPAWTTRHAGTEGLADEALAVVVRPTPYAIYATGTEGKAANGGELLFLELSTLGVVGQAIATNYLGNDRGQDLALRSNDNAILVGGEQGFGTSDAAPLLVAYSPAIPAVLTTLSPGATASVGLHRLAVNAQSNTFGLAAAGTGTVFRRWDTANALSQSALEARRWTAIAPHRSTDHALVAGSYMGDLVIGKISNAVAVDWAQTRARPGEDVPVEIATYGNNDFVVVVNEIVEGRGSNVRLVQYNDAGTMEIATVTYDSGPDSEDVAIAAGIDSAGQVNVLGKTGSAYWVRRWSRTLVPVRSIPIAATGTGMALYDLAVDPFGNLVMVGSEDVGGQRDVVVRKIGP